MTSFNDGIEAAKVAVRQSLEGAAMAAEQTHGEDVAAGLEEVSVRLLSKLDALKRPELSEPEKVERLAEWLCNGFSLDGWDGCEPDRKEDWRNDARAALAAAGGGA